MNLSLAFTVPPFGRDLPVKFLFTTPAHEEPVSRLKYAAEKRLFALITGEVGAGKSTALRQLVSLLNPNKYPGSSISAILVSRPDIFYWKALRQLDCEPWFIRGQAKRQLHQVVLDLAEN